jgi:hypothetical protein
MLHTSGLLAAGTVGFAQHLKMSSPVGFEVADSVMDLLHLQPSALLRVLANHQAPKTFSFSVARALSVDIAVGEGDLIKDVVGD